jgi:serine/threonine protein kinase
MPKPKPTADQIERASESLGRRLRAHAGEAKVVKMLRVGSGSRPHVAVVVMDGVECVVKDHQGCDRWFARLLGPILSRREVRALRRLDEVQGIPCVLRVFDSRAFAMSKMDAQPYRGSRVDSDTWRRFFEEMDRLVSHMHRLGVAHCDLRSPDNTLMTAQGAPVIVDFVASYTRGASWNLWSRWVFTKFCEVDRSAIEKQRRTISYTSEVGAERREARRSPTLLEKVARGFGVFVRKLTRRLFTDEVRK